MRITGIRKCKVREHDTICNEKPTQKELAKLGKKMEKELKRRGLRCDVETAGDRVIKYKDAEGNTHQYVRKSNIKGHTIGVSGCVLTEEYAGRYGKNVGGYWKQKRTRYLSWEDWVEFNDAINDVLDENKISANAQSLGGKFVQRRGLERMTRDDWEGGYYQNVGSMMNPMERGSMYQSEGRGREGWREDQRKKKERKTQRGEQQKRAIKEKYPSVRTAIAHKKMYGRY